MFLGILTFSIFQNNKNEHLIKLTINTEQDWGGQTRGETKSEERERRQRNKEERDQERLGRKERR
jgi:hypothetical protein